MGGTVGVTIKRNNEIKKMARKTGSYSSMLFSEEMIKGDIEKALKDYYKIFDDMRDDFLSGEPYKFNMTPCYGWCNEMVPCGYGLVYIDFDKKEIHSMQGYDTPGSFISLELRSKEAIEKYKSFFEKDLVKVIYEKDSIKKEYSLEEYFKRKNITNDVLIENLLDGKIKEDLYYIRFQLKDWNIVCYEENISGIISFFKEVKHLLSKEEINLWKEYAKNSMEDYYDSHIEELETNNSYEKQIELYIEEKAKKFLSKFNI